MYPLRSRRRTQDGAVLALALTTLAVTACGDAGPTRPDAGEDVPDIRGEQNFTDPYTGEYDEDFAEDLEAYDGLEVTLEAEVAEVLSPRTFVITAPDQADVPPLLVVHPEDLDLAPGETVIVAATPDVELDLQEGEEAAGTDLDDQAYEQWMDEPYLIASNVEKTPVTGQ